MKLALALILAIAPCAHAGSLTIHRAWSSSEYSCANVSASGTPYSGHVEAVCGSVFHYQDVDHLLVTGFDEQPIADWSYRVRMGSVVTEQGGCALGYISASDVLLICN